MTKLHTIDITVLEEYYKNPVVESFTYVSIGMDALKSHDYQMYQQIQQKQKVLSLEMNEMRGKIRNISSRLGLAYEEVAIYLDQFLQKFPLALRINVAWDDSYFVFLYILTKMLKPKVVIETGCNLGFSSTFIALAVKENNNQGKFYTIDIADEITQQWREVTFVKENNIRKQEINYEKLDRLPLPKALSVVPPDLREHIFFIRGSVKTILPSLLVETKEVDIFFHDSEHSYRNILWECISAFAYVRKGGYILVHDTYLNSSFGDMFGKKGGIVIGNALGAFKKIGDDKELEFIVPVTPPKNALRNDQEFKAGKDVLDSFPKTVIVQMPVKCNLNCVFCPMDKKMQDHNIYYFVKGLENRMGDCFPFANQFVLKFCGNIIPHSLFELVLRKFQESFPEVDKLFSLHGECLTPPFCDLLVSHNWRSFYSTNNIIQITVSASEAGLYKTLTGSDRYQHIIECIRHLIKARSDEHHTQVHLIFVATTFNIEDLPQFVRLAAELGVDKVICYYNYIYIPTQKYLSCFFKQEITNRMLEEAERIAQSLHMPIDLPPRFGQAQYPPAAVCREPFSQIMFDADGHVLPCDTSKDCYETLGEDKGFMDIWNGPYYQNMRESLLEGTCSCFKYCIRANPASVNDFKSHVIYRGGRRDEDIHIL